MTTYLPIVLATFNEHFALDALPICWCVILLRPIQIQNVTLCLCTLILTGIRGASL
jgi:hypothetical protein